MDTSETYIKQCDCPEIQEMRWERPPWGSFKTLEKGDFYVRFGDKRHISIYDGDTDDLFDENIWLPTQSDLQEMVRDKMGLWVMLDRINQFQKGYFPKPNTMEQLWLAFVMMEKHNKTWTGETWEGGEDGK